MSRKRQLLGGDNADSDELARQLYAMATARKYEILGSLFFLIFLSVRSV